jgi:hypothetical protein
MKNLIKKILKESDWDWTNEKIYVTEETVRRLLSGCVDIPVAAYNKSTKSPYTRRGNPNIYYISMCPYWWDRLKGVPDSMGRDGWFEEPYSDNLVAIIMPETLDHFDDIRDLDNEDISAVHFPISQVVRHIDGSSKSSEVWLPIDNNGDIIYDLTPPEMVDDIKNAYGKGLNESEEDDWKWVDDIPDPYDKVDTSQDYVGEWEHFKPSFYKACIDIKGGKVVSSDYSGYIRIELDTANQGKLRFFIEYRYIDDGPEPFVETEWLVYKDNLLLKQSKNRDDAEGGLYGPIKKFIEEKLNVCGKGLTESEEDNWGWVKDINTHIKDVLKVIFEGTDFYIKEEQTDLSNFENGFIINSFAIVSKLYDSEYWTDYDYLYYNEPYTYETMLEDLRYDCNDDSYSQEFREEFCEIYNLIEKNKKMFDN